METMTDYKNLSKGAKALFDIIEFVNGTGVFKVCKQGKDGLWYPVEVTEKGISSKYGALQ